MNSITFLNILNLCVIIFAGNFSKHANWKLINEEECGETLSDRIIGGTVASLGQYPWIAHLGYGMYSGSFPQFLCGGTLINNRYVLSAAHCVTAFPDDRQLTAIRLGEYDTRTDEDCDAVGHCAAPFQDYKPEKIIWHDEYDSFTNDISLIRLSESVLYTRWISPICLPQGRILKQSFLQKNAIVAGWGFYQVGISEPSPLLQVLKLPVVPLKRCQEVFPSLAMDRAKQLCAGGIKGKDSCNGDSGGPLMKVIVMNNEAKYVLIGCVSFGVNDCATMDIPSVYTRVGHYMPWILDHIQE